MSTRFPGDGRIGAIVILIALAFAALSGATALGQGVEATPAPARLVTRAPEPVAGQAPTITPSFTPTELPGASLQALQSAGNVNVRALPDIESELLGTIAHGTLYPAVRRYYRWYELRFNLSPNGRAWVYGDLVTIEGDPSQIETVDNLEAVVNAAFANAGAVDDADQSGVNPRTVAIATLAEDEGRALEVVDATPLPTFTPPPTRSPSVDQLDVVDANEQRLLNLPSLVPILALAGLGSLGLLISFLRR